MQSPASVLLEPRKQRTRTRGAGAWRLGWVARTRPAAPPGGARVPAPLLVPPSRARAWRLFRQGALHVTRISAPVVEVEGSRTSIWRVRGNQMKAAERAGVCSPPRMTPAARSPAAAVLFGQRRSQGTLRRQVVAKPPGFRKRRHDEKAEGRKGPNPTQWSASAASTMWSAPCAEQRRRGRHATLGTAQVQPGLCRWKQTKDRFVMVWGLPRRRHRRVASRLGGPGAPSVGQQASLQPRCAQSKLPGRVRPRELAHGASS